LNGEPQLRTNGSLRNVHWPGGKQPSSLTLFRVVRTCHGGRDTVLIARIGYRVPVRDEVVVQGIADALRCLARSPWSSERSFGSLHRVRMDADLKPDGSHGPLGTVPVIARR